LAKGDEGREKNNIPAFREKEWKKVLIFVLALAFSLSPSLSLAFAEGELCPRGGLRAI